MERDNLFDAFGHFWNSADDVRRLVRYGRLTNKIQYFGALQQYADALASSMDAYEHAQEEDTKRLNEENR